MQNKKKFYIYVILAVLWIGFVFCRSMQPSDRSVQESRWVLNLLQHLFPFDVSMHFVRKAAHFFEFTVLGGLVWVVLRQRFKTRWSSIVYSVVIGLVIALCDETIQLFVVGRSGKIQDTWLDVLGVVFGTFLTAFVYGFWRRHKTK